MSSYNVLSTLLLAVGILILLGITFQFSSQMKTLLGSSNRDWWIKIRTLTPAVTYFFGPFDSISEAQGHEAGFLEDLTNEGASKISVKIKKYQPTILTIEEAVNS